VRRALVLIALVGAVGLAAELVVGLRSGGHAGDPPELDRYARDWPAPGQNLNSTRAVRGSPIDAGSVSRLRVRWRFRFPTEPGYSGVFASTPLVLGDRVYVQDLDSDVYALDRATGRLVWRRRFLRPDGGPNGLAAGYGRLFGNTDVSAFALDRGSGRVLWQRKLTRSEQPITIAPVVARGLVYTSVTGFAPGGRGRIVALDARTGRRRWSFDTIRDPWRFPKEASGGGPWDPISVGSDGRVYAGNSNPYPWGGSKRHPNGGMYPGRVLYTDSLLVLDGRNGRLRWYDQVTPHDVRDYDLEASPILAGSRVFGAGKAGLVVAWDRGSGRRLWTEEVGVHRNDSGPLPRGLVSVCPGLLGGVETPMAYAAGRLFVPVVDFCTKESAYGTSALSFYTLDASKGRGELVALDGASGRQLWRRRFPAPDFGCAAVAGDVVFTATYDGRIYGLSARDGRVLWQERARAGINACPAIAGDLLLVGAGTDYPPRGNSLYELVAYALR
jgi:outer membrane protein assembly factor BamB